MRILIDTNILFSVALYPNSMPQKAFDLVTYLCGVELIAVPNTYIDAETKIRDIDDRTIYRAAVKAKADIILTGDKDLLESGITSPQIMTAREFLNLNNCE